MAFTTITGDLTTSTVMAVGDTVVALEGSSIITFSNGIASTGTANGTKVYANGAIVTIGQAVHMYGTDTGAADGVGNHLLVVGSTGSLTGNQYGATLAGSGNTLINWGEMSGLSRDTVELVNADNAYVENHGMMFGYRAGLRFTGSDDVDVVNFGTISAITNNGVGLDSSQGSVFNAGTISAAADGRSAISVSSTLVQGRSDIENTGTITSPVIAINGQS
ncbi:MAG: hypothetical protein ACI8R4_002237, partial [Paracoccaceae bacterium]